MIVIFQLHTVCESYTSFTLFSVFINFITVQDIQNPHDHIQLLVLR